MRKELIVFRAIDDKVFPVVATGTGEAEAVDLMTDYPNADFQLFFGYLQVLPMDAKEDRSDWELTRWHRLMTPDGKMWCETSSETEIEYELSGEAYRDAIADMEDGDEVLPTPEGLIHQRLYQSPIETEWRNV